MRSVVFIFILSTIALLGFSQQDEVCANTEREFIGYEIKPEINTSEERLTTMAYKKGLNNAPVWAKAYGYTHRHIYFPRYQCYYDKYNGVYIYHNGSKWVRRFAIPTFMTNLNLNSLHIVELSMDHTSNPQTQFIYHLILYPPYN